MAKAHLIKTVVEQAPVGLIDSFLWDNMLPGFGVKITPAGGKVYLVQYRPKSGRTTRRYTIGRHGAPWTTAKAREAAELLLARVKLGEDPFLADSTKRIAENASVAATLQAKAAANHAIIEADLAAEAARVRAEAEAFRTVISQFVKLYAEPRNRCWRDAERVLGAASARGWERRPVSKITKQDVLDLTDQVAERSQASARVMFAHLRKFFSWCVERGYLDVSPCAGISTPGTNVIRDRWLSDDELELVWAASDKCPPSAPMRQIQGSS